MAIGSGKFNVQHSAFNELKASLTEAEIGIATSTFREAYKAIASIIVLNDIIIEQMKIQAINKTITLRRL